MTFIVHNKYLVLTAPMSPKSMFAALVGWDYQTSLWITWSAAGFSAYSALV
jgi:hypothetical protein